MGSISPLWRVKARRWSGSQPSHRGEKTTRRCQIAALARCMEQRTAERHSFILHASFSFLPSQLSSPCLSFGSFSFLQLQHCFVFVIQTIFRFSVVLCFPRVKLIPDMTTRGSSCSLFLSQPPERNGACFNKHPWKTQLRGLSKNTLRPVSFPPWICFFSVAKLRSIILIPKNARYKERKHLCEEGLCVLQKHTPDLEVFCLLC